MRFELDENLPTELVDVLALAGHDGATVYQQSLGGSADARLAALCQQEDRVLVTLDMDFADIRAYPPGEHPGMVVLRLTRHDKQHVLTAFARAARLLDTEPLAGSLWIVEDHRIRIRH